MSDWIFDIFGDRTGAPTRAAVPNTTQFSNNENVGKTLKSVQNDPAKPNEPMKKAGDGKKSFLSNKGTAIKDLQTPQKVCRTPAQKTLSQLIYEEELDDNFILEELKFIKDKACNDNFYNDMLSKCEWCEPYEPQICLSSRTPPPRTMKPQLEFMESFELDGLLTDDFSTPEYFEFEDYPFLPKF